MRPNDAMAGVARESIVPISWFGFAAAWTLRSAFRRQECTSLISVSVRREYCGWNVAVRGDQYLELTAAIVPVLREADIFGDLVDESFGILLIDADEAAAHRVIHRVAEKLGTVPFWTPATFAIGAAVSPTHGIELAALLEHAASHPVLSLRPRFTAADRKPRMPKGTAAV